MKVGLRKILVVDSDAEAAWELSSLFMKEGYDVEISTGITKAAERIGNVKFDCVIMDVNLPEMMGYEAVSILKAIDPKVQIIMTSADNTPELEAEVRKQNIFFYYIKSFDREELKEAVRDVFKKLGKSKEAKKMDKPQKVLIVDDDQSFVTAITLVLESRGYQLATAHNKEEAMEEIGKHKPDLILLDIMMERITDGFNLCYKLKHDPEMKKIPVLAVSAITKETGFKVSPATDGEYFEADDYMEKPVKPSELLERIEKLLKG
ncbi:MAG TPA: response regulator [Sedimentisphaerales bacterium]|nr:response regulator [Sedimentisphaerales bacterium]